LRLVSEGTSGDSDESDSSDADANSRRVTIISARLDAVVTQGIYTPAQYAATATSAGPATSAGSATTASSASVQLPAITTSYTALPALPPKLHQAYVLQFRGSTASAADAYARTRDLSDHTPLIDTYA
jgi:hypothetical protein